jgi:hypothetical protein
LKTRELAKILCKIRFVKDLDIKIRETKDLETDDFFQWSVGLNHRLGARLWKARLDVTRREKSLAKRLHVLPDPPPFRMTSVLERGDVLGR